jgi:small membrane protein
MIVPILLIGLALILAYIGSRKQLSRTQLLFVLLFFSIGVVSVLFQPLTTRAAAYLNVGRGADLLLYFSVLCGVLIAANFYFRFKETERILVEVVRKMAILSPRHPTGQSLGE